MKQAIRVLLEKEVKDMVKDNGIEGAEDIIKKEFENMTDLQSELLLTLYKMYWMGKKEL